MIYTDNQILGPRPITNLSYIDTGYYYNNVKIYEGKYVPYQNELRGSVFQCMSLLEFIAGTSDAGTLKNLNECKKVTEFTVDNWVRITDLVPRTMNSDWQLQSRTLWEGVEWLKAEHSGDGGDSCCAAIATFTCTAKIVIPVENGKILTCTRPKYESIDLRHLLNESKRNS